jgi:hypothetical protein
VAQTAAELDFCDIDPNFIEECRLRNPLNDSFLHDFCESEYPKRYDVIYCLDVIEHIPKNMTTNFITNIYNTLNDGGTLILGTPSLESQAWASEESRKGHINCRSQDEWRQQLQRPFKRTFCFSMNDEVLHTGFGPMSHYLFFLSVR